MTDTKIKRISLSDLLTKDERVCSLQEKERPEKIRKILEAYLNEFEVLEIDLSNLRSLTPSLAYIAFGHLFDIFGDRISTNLRFIEESPILSSRILDAIDRRKRVLESEKNYISVTV